MNITAKTAIAALAMTAASLSFAPAAQADFASDSGSNNCAEFNWSKDRVLDQSTPVAEGESMSVTVKIAKRCKDVTVIFKSKDQDEAKWTTLLEAPVKGTNKVVFSSTSTQLGSKDFRVIVKSPGHKRVVSDNYYMWFPEQPTPEQPPTVPTPEG